MESIIRVFTYFVVTYKRKLFLYEERTSRPVAWVATTAINFRSASRAKKALPEVDRASSEVVATVAFYQTRSATAVRGASEYSVQCLAMFDVLRKLRGGGTRYRTFLNRLPRRGIPFTRMQGIAAGEQCTIARIEPEIRHQLL